MLRNRIEIPNEDAKTDNNNNLMRSTSNIKQISDLKIPDNLIKFNKNSDSLKFSTIGLYNTKREKSLYRIVATIEG